MTLTNWHLSDNRIETIVLNDKTYSANDILKHMQDAKEEIVRVTEGFDVYTNMGDNYIIIDKNSLKDDDLQIHAYKGDDTLHFKNFKTDDIKEYRTYADSHVTLTFDNDKSVTYINTTSINFIKFDDKTFTKDEFDEHLKSTPKTNL